MKTEIIVRMPNGEDYPVRQLLGDGDSNAKLAKSNKAGKGYKTYGLSFAPARSSGFEVCPGRSKGCTRACLFFAGHGTIPSVMRGRVAKTRAWMMHRDAFKAMLLAEVTAAERKATREGLDLAIRLNVLSDIQWETEFPELFTTFPRVTFYDYTKVAGRTVPKNYKLTFSRSEENDALALAEYARGLNVAVVFETADLPKRWNGIKVFDGDKTDLRFLDKRGIVGLYAKGRARKDESGFVVANVIPLQVTQ